MGTLRLRVVLQVLLVAVAFAVIAYYYEKMIRINIKFLESRGKTVIEETHTPQRARTLQGESSFVGEGHDVDTRSVSRRESDN